MNEANKYGPWNLIGYTAPGTAAADGKSSSTTNFTYSGAEVNESGVKAAVSGAWVANNIATLNDCAPAASSGNWTVSTNEIGSDGQDSYRVRSGFLRRSCPCGDDPDRTGASTRGRGSGPCSGVRSDSGRKRRGCCRDRCMRPSVCR